MALEAGSAVWASSGWVRHAFAGLLATRLWSGDRLQDCLVPNEGKQEERGGHEAASTPSSISLQASSCCARFTEIVHPTCVKLGNLRLPSPPSRISQQASFCCVQVTELMHETCIKTKMKAEDFKFKPARGWLGGQSSEKIEGWSTKIYEASGKMNAITTYKVKPRHSGWYTDSKASLPCCCRAAVQATSAPACYPHLNRCRTCTNSCAIDWHCCRGPALMTAFRIAHLRQMY